MGKALIALQRGETKLAENLFEQAATLSGGSEVSRRYTYLERLRLTILSPFSARSKPWLR
jgi:hypothetical protein